MFALAQGPVGQPSPQHVQEGSLTPRVAPRIDSIEVVDAQGTPLAVELPIEPGDFATRDTLRSLTLSLLQNGQWSNAQLFLRESPRGSVLRVELTPKARVFRIEVNGAEALSESQVARALRLAEGSVVDESRLMRAETLLIEEYERLGYAQATARLFLRDTDEPQDKVLVIELLEGPQTEIAEVLIVGDEVPRRARLRSFLELSSGDAYLPSAVQESEIRAIERLKSVGYLEARFELDDLRRESPSEVTLIFRLRLGPRYEVRITGTEAAPELDREDFVDLVLEGGEPLRNPLSPLERRLASVVVRHGYPEASVRVLPVQPREPEPGYDAVLLVDFSLGPKVLIERVVFDGESHFEEGHLREQFDAALTEANDVGSSLELVDEHDVNELLGGGDGMRRVERPLPTTPTGVWHEPSMEFATNHLQELFRAEGYLSAEVGPAVLVAPEHGQSEDLVQRSEVRVPIRQGPRTRLFGVRLEGNEALTDEEVLIASDFERSQPFSYLALEHAEDAIEDAYQARGYYYARVSSELSFSANGTRVQISFSIDEQSEVRVREVLIAGADRTRQRLIRRVAGIEEGQLLTPEALRSAQDRLLDLGIFAGVHVTPQDPDVADPNKPVMLLVTERRTQALDGSIGLSTAQGARGALEYSVHNISGLALEASARVQLGYQFFFIDSVLESRYENLRVLDQLERRVVLSLAAPYIGIPNVRASLSLSHIRENERNFGLDSNTLDLTFRWRALRFLSLSLSGGLENNAIDILGEQSYRELLEETSDLRLRGLLRVPEGETTLVSTEVTATLDRRDSPFVPTRGYYAALSFEWARTVRDNVVDSAGDEEVFSSNHFRFQLSTSAYVPLGRSWVFAAQLRFGRMIHLTNRSQSYPNRKFFLGGVDTVRGYLQDSLVPQDIADEICDPRTDTECMLGADFNPNAVVQGGDVFLSVRGELRFPIYSSLRGGLFVDFGNTWVDPTKLSLRLRPSAGIGIRISTPVGPIAFDYGFLLARREFLGEPIGSFHFSIGLF